MAAVLVAHETRPRAVRPVTRYAVALLQAVGGAIGLGAVLGLVAGPAREALLASGPAVALVLLVSALYLLGLAAGAALWLRPRAGVRLSIANQLAQLLVLEVPGLTYRVVGGAFLLVGVTAGREGEGVRLGGNFDFQLLASDFSVHFGQPAAGVSASVNLLALAILAWLWRQRRSRAGAARV